MELLKVYAALLRRKWLFLQAVVFFTGGASVLALVLPKKFEAAAKISVETSDASLSVLGDLDLGEIASSLTGSSDDIQTKISLAQMRPILDEVIWRLQLRDSDGELLPAEKLLVPGIDGEILAYPWIEIVNATGTSILVVTATANQPDLAANLADTVVEVYLSISEDRQRQDTREARDFVEKQLVTIKGEVDQALSVLADEQAREQVINLDAEQKAAVSRASEALTELQGIGAEMAGLRAQINEKARLNSRESVDLVSPASIAGNTQIRDLKDALKDLQLARQKEILDKTDRHPDILLIDQQIAGVQAQLAVALSDAHQLDPAVDQLQMTYTGLQRRKAEVEANFQQTVTEFSAYPDKMRKIAGLQLAADATQEIYKSLLEQAYQIAVAEAMTVSDMKGVEPAKAPDKAAAPKLLVYLVLGFFVGCAVGVGLVFLFEYIDDSVKDQDQLREVWPVPVLGMVPRFRHKNTSLIAELPPTDPIFEAYRSVRNAVAFSSVDSPINILAVTSCVPGEGKSTLMTNLGICLANDGQRVVIVDGDLRRPTQHKTFPELSNAVGVSNVLAGGMPVSEAVQQSPIPNLAVLTSGPVPANPGRLVESLRMRQMLLELSGQYDMVLVDAPPLLVVGDAIALARSSKGLIVAMEHGKTTRRMVGDLRARLEAAGVESTGVVFNKVDLRAGGYGHYYNYARAYGETRATTGRQRGKAS
jgi:capsular exopolysaccharide synthesis family protein